MINTWLWKKNKQQSGGSIPTVFTSNAPSSSLSTIAPISATSTSTQYQETIKYGNN